MGKKERTASSNNHLNLLFVFIAFSMMALASYFFIGRILQNRLLSGAHELLFSAEAYVKAGFSEAEATLLNSYHIVQSMVERGAPREEILDYLIVTTEWMRKRDQGLLGYYGIYGYINGEIYDSMGFNPGGDYIPQTRPWYQTALASGSSVAYTAPYTDMRTGDTVVSAVRMIDINNGEVVGVLALDINIKWVVDYVGSLALAQDGYGILLSQDMTFIAYPDSAFIGRRLQGLGGSYREIARTLRASGEVSAERIRDSDGGSTIVFFKKIFNNWYVGIVTPYSQFYRDLYASAQILAALGLVLSLSLCFLLLRLSAAKTRADENNKSKSLFLASMSHEIRTPMNAIIGMAELLLRGKLSDEARSHAQDIKQAGNNLVSIINDILDFSKIEAGRLEIFPVKYLLSSLVNDTANIVRMRIGEKPLRFFTNVDGGIPNSLIGDEVRLRQILLNLLSNAVKYCEKGHIGLTITTDKRDDKQVWLKIAVTDTGKGIRQEDQARLFDEFVRVDVKKNQGIEGTGLGLAITKRLCNIMGGDITMKSEYGKGSEFTVVIPQGIESEAPFASVEEPEKKKVLVYEGRLVYAGSICWTLENLKVPYTMVTNQNDFETALCREEWFYIFSGYGLYNRIKLLKSPPLALLIEWGTEAYIPGVRFVSIPVQSLSIANVLNGKADSKDYANSSDIICFTFPHARLLVVDDIATNLQVAKGLLTPYMAVVDTCLSGSQAVEMAKQHEYDIIFMDHMMPVMDGIEATALIRAWEKERQEQYGTETISKQCPIIALTANAVVGMREMFLENGFNDFLAKPIDVSKLDEILDRWIPKEKREQREHDSPVPKAATPPPQSPVPIPGVDMAKGIVMTGGTEAGYRTVLSMFCKDVENRLFQLQTVPKTDALNSFIIHVHSLKSTSASIGAVELPVQAAALEAAGKAGDIAFIQDNLAVFVKSLSELTAGILAWEKAVKENDSEKQADAGGALCDIDNANVLPLLHELAQALKSQKGDVIDRILEQIARQPLDTGVKTAVDKIADEVLIAEYEKALEILDSLL